MPIIVDNDRVAVVFFGDACNGYRKLYEEVVEKQRNVFHYGGKLAKEYFNSSKLRRLILELEREGKVKNIGYKKVEEETKKVKRTGLCKSNDEHIIALARVGGARILCTKDGKLMDDFRNARLLKPRGKLFSLSPQNTALEKDCQKYLRDNN